MPELPEVETVRRGLEQKLIGQTISKVDAVWSKSVWATPTQVKKLMVRQKIDSIARRGKVLIINLSNAYTLLIHLKMTGQLVFVEKKGKRFAGGHPTPSMIHDLPDRSTRVVFTFESDDKLFFNDQRKFGWIQLVPSEEVGKHSLVSRLGPEPLSADFNLKDFQKILSRRPRAPIKGVIMDQGVVAGVGNIYADEALHLARIHPATMAARLKPAQIKRLYDAIKGVLELALGYGGTTFTTYVNALGVKGNYLEYARAFRRQGQPCPVCGTPIKKIRLGGRGTHFCPKCQKIPKS